MKIEERKMNVEIVKVNQNLDNLLDRFVAYLDVSPASVRSYVSGIKRFLAFLSSKGITTPTRNTVITYKKTLTEKYSANTCALSLSALKTLF